MILTGNDYNHALIIGDVHGCLKTLKKLYETVTAKYPGEPVVLTGDLIDRGPRSREVVQFVIDNKILCVRGNHEEMMIYESDWWGMNGGWETQACYQKPFRQDPVYREHQKWMAALPKYMEFQDLKTPNGRHLVVTHAFLREGSLEKQIQHPEFGWNRFVPPHSTPYFNVCGHTPYHSPKITEWYAGIDTGCVFQDKGYSKLTCLRFPEMEIIQQENEDK